MIDRKALLADLKKQVGTLEGDLRERAADDAETHARLHGEWQKAREANRIAATYESWLDDRVTQAAVAWVLGTVFLRFCEDNGLIEMPFLAGPGDKLDLAQERQADYIRQNPHDTDREWILAGFKEMSRSPVAAGLFNKAHNPMWQIEIPHHAAKALLAFWRQRGEDGEIVHDFTDPDWDTRFLGDLYQDLSEHAKKTYALLQTPDFVEEFILDYTLEPAIDEFGLAGLRLIDPTCGSGHFLLGAFHRILNKWRAAEPGTDIWKLIRRTLLAIHGVDKNAFAVGIARFRILVAAMREGRVATLVQCPDFEVIVASGDSLLHGRGAVGIQLSFQGEDFSENKPHTYETEDIYAYIGASGEVEGRGIDLLGVGSYHVVVGNPPYITVKDKRENENYRKAHPDVCSRTYSLSVPFMQRFFQLAINGDVRGAAGYVGQITANSFAKREFGKKVIEQYLPTVDLTHIIDTSGAYIPGHGTPTVILYGRRRWPSPGTRVLAARSVRGEPRVPDDPSKGLVWTAIVSQIADIRDGERWVSVRPLERERYFGRHPWILTAGGLELVEELEKATESRLSSRVELPIGRAVRVGADEAFVRPSSYVRRRSQNTDCWRPLLVGEEVRDWVIGNLEFIFYPYGSFDKELAVRELWNYKTLLAARRTFQGDMEAAGLKWWQYMQHTKSAYKTPLSIAFGEVASHNHFSLDRGGRVFKQTAPVIKLPEGNGESDHLDLLGVLNSSSACFWLKQNCYPKGGDPVGDEGARVSAESWHDRFAFNASNIERLPLPVSYPSELAEELERCGRRIGELSSFELSANLPITSIALASKRQEYDYLRERLVALQEELDWEIYAHYGLVGGEYIAGRNVLPGLKPGQRAFEIALARTAASGEGESEWFERHGITPVTEIPEGWPEDYKQIVEKRISVIESRRDIALIERPDCKRRWASEPWEKRERASLRTWLLDRCEERSLWFADDDYGIAQPRLLTVNQLADQLRHDENFVPVAGFYAGDDAELSKVIAEVTQDEHVPHLAAHRYKFSGLRKRAQWENVWELQREEDRAGTRLDISIPPKYAPADFLKVSYWRNRGKLDVPKERFISYPGGGPDGDSSMLLGWAGWDHREQAQALMMLIEERATQDGWDAARLTPLLAGLAEVLPWVRQWHGEVDPAFGQSPADAYTMYLEDKQRAYGISDEDLKNWRPERPKRGRKKKDS